MRNTDLAKESVTFTFLSLENCFSLFENYAKITLASEIANLFLKNAFTSSITDDNGFPKS